jgi:hypothetical protein
MMIKRILGLFVIIVISTAVSAPVNRPFSDGDTSEDEFVLVKKGSGILLYEKWNTIGNEKAREIKAVFEVDSEFHSILSLLQHEPSGTKWNKNTETYKIKQEKDHWICYIVYDLPWPASDQDCVLKFTEVATENSITLQFHSVDHAAFPKDNSLSRIEDITGKWVLNKSQKGIDVEYYISTKPSKSMPRWITDPIIRGNMLKGMAEFKRLLED